MTLFVSLSKRVSQTIVSMRFPDGQMVPKLSARMPSNSILVTFTINKIFFSVTITIGEPDVHLTKKEHQILYKFLKSTGELISK